MASCLICGSPVEPFMSFGKMPIANGFLTPEQFREEYFFELKVAHCPTCSMVQLTELVEREKMFHENYAFFSSTSTRMAAHFARFAERAIERCSTASDPFVVEIGSNDGIMLQHFAKRGWHHLGIEPSANVARAAREKSIETLCEFFDADLARRVSAEHGKADIILAANVMCHIPYLHSIVEGIETLLKPHGLLMFEDPYLGDILEKTSYDQVYDEHAFYFSLASISYLFERHGLEVVDVEPQNVHGGSMRYVIAHKGRFEPSPAVAQLQAGEKGLGLNRAQTYQQLCKRIERSRDELVSLLRRLKKEGKRVVGYGATSKSTTVTNFCGITPDLVEFISDTTPTKQGKFSPGAHIPVKPHAEFSANFPDYALLFAWNHAEEIMAKEEDFQRQGGKWIVYVPEVEVRG